MDRLKNGSFIVVPSLYLYYLSKKNIVHAHSNINERELNKPKLIQDVNTNLKSYCYKSVIKPSTYLKQSRLESQNLIEAFRVINNVPGVTCAVSYRGEELWAFGNGLADVETRAPCTDETVMRIASISKSITMLLLGKLIEEGKIDLDKPISEYLDKKMGPDKYFNNEKVHITLRELVSHLGGIRHYKKVKENSQELEPEYYLNVAFENVYDTLNIFKNDDLISKPGTKFLYTTFGFTLISAVLQSVLGESKKFEDELMKILRNELRMDSTYLDSNENIIPNRAKYYKKKVAKCSSETPIESKLINVPEINNSYKIAGGGLLSNVHDLLKFGNAILYSYKTPNGILKQQTINQFWTPNELTKSHIIKDVPYKYAMGFAVTDEKAQKKYAGLKKKMLNKVVFHTGAAVGVTSILLILPEEEIVVAILANLINCQGIDRLSMDIAKKVYENLVNVHNSKY